VHPHAFSDKGDPRRPRRTGRNWRGRLAAAFAAMLGLGFAALAAPARAAGAESRPITPRGELAADEKATIALFERSRDSVVFISTREQVRDFWSRNILSVPKGTGSGFIWDEAGHVVTNYHVIEGASEATIKLADGRSYKATLVGGSPGHDIAVLKVRIGGRQPAPLPLGSSHDLRVGQKVFAIGNPFGLDWTLTSGIVSALNRSLTTEGGQDIEHLIQTDAAINPGNSGGPLLDSAGRLIGINAAIYSPSGTNAGIGFAVPADTVNRVVPQLIRYGKYRRPALGIEVDEELNRQLLAVLGTKGVAVLRVARGEAADRAGLRGIRVDRDDQVIPGDVITAVEGKPVESVGQLDARLDEFSVGTKVRLTLLRGGRHVDVYVNLQAQD
jgi:S1-C subfamily serine protease